MDGLLFDTMRLALIIAGAVIVLAVCGQGRLRHLLLSILRAAPKPAKKQSSLIHGIPRAEREWFVVGRLQGLDGPPEAFAPPPRELVLEEPDTTDSEQSVNSEG